MLVIRIAILQSTNQQRYSFNRLPINHELPALIIKNYKVIELQVFNI